MTLELLKRKISRLYGIITGAITFLIADWSEKLSKKQSGIGYISLLPFFIFVPVIMFLLKHYNYLLFHTCAELYSIVICFCLFVISWNARKLITEKYLVFLGIAYLFIGIIDLAHALSYKGLNIFVGYSANVSTQLWIAGRYLESISIISSFYFIKRKLKVNIVFLIFFTVTFVVILLVFTGNFPDCFLPGHGLTDFKKGSEYFISFLLIISIIALFGYRSSFEKTIFILLCASYGLTIISELAFTLYSDVYGIFNFIGHIFKIYSYYLIYRAIVRKGIQEPYRSYYYNLKQKEKRLSNEVVELKELTDKDPLIPETYNARHIINKLKLEIKRAKRYGNSLAMAFIDIDDFKKINDSYGHFFGDVVLRNVAEIFMNDLREEDIFGRYGGDEFIAIFPQTNSAKAEITLLRIQNQLHNFKLDLPDNGKVQVSVSIGIAELDSDSEDGFKQLFNYADEALYFVKSNKKGSLVQYNNLTSGKS